MEPATSPESLAERVARVLDGAQDDTRFALETFLTAVEGGHPAHLELFADRGKGGRMAQVEGRCSTGVQLRLLE